MILMVFKRLNRCNEEEKKDVLTILESPKTALVMNAKFANLPLQITGQVKIRQIVQAL